jgi:hypothetical protein
MKLEKSADPAVAVAYTISGCTISSNVLSTSQETIIADNANTPTMFFIFKILHNSLILIINGP